VINLFSISISISISISTIYKRANLAGKLDLGRTRKSIQRPKFLHSPPVSFLPHGRVIISTPLITHLLPTSCSSNFGSRSHGSALPPPGRPCIALSRTPSYYPYSPLLWVRSSHMRSPAWSRSSWSQQLMACR
jgi:hypothetical protein